MMVLTDFSYYFQGTYSVASRIGHSCLSNSSAVFEPDGQITVRAALPIPKGSKILYTYECNPLYGTYNRNYVLCRMLGTTRYVSCLCERCKDPTELGSFIGGIYCPICPDQQGILLPEIAQKEESEHGMVCNKCRTRHTNQFVMESIILPMQVEYDEIDEEIDRYESFISKYEKILHRHSHWMLRFKGGLLQRYFFQSELNPELQSGELLYLSQLVKYLF